MLALRTMEGAPGRDFAPAQRNPLEELIQAGLLEMSAGRVRLTEAGVAVANEVCLRLMG